MNPTNDVLEQRIAALEGGAAALAVSSGQAASAIAVQNIAGAGDNIVSSTDLYGGTWNLFANTFKTMGIEVRFVDPRNPEAFRRATDSRTRAYYAESLPNPEASGLPDQGSSGDRRGTRPFLSSLTIPQPRSSAGLSSMVRISLSIRPPSTSAVMAPPSAV